MTEKQAELEQHILWLLDSAEGHELAGRIPSMRRCDQIAVILRSMQSQEQEIDRLKAITTRDPFVARYEAEKRAGEAEEVLEALRVEAKRVLEHNGGDGMGEDAFYCWWCDRNINGHTGEKEPHKDDCCGVALRALLGKE